MKTLWAFEPFYHTKKSLKGMHSLLQQLSSPPHNIEVGFVVTRTEPQLNTDLDIPYIERFTTRPHQLIKSTLKKATVPMADNKIHVVDYETFSNTKAVDKLLALAKSRHADLIALYSHSRQGMERLVLGSFAETAIHRSRTSLLVVNPKVKIPNKIKNIFYASDFSSTANKQLQRVLALCKQTKAKLTVFHGAEVIYSWSLDEKNPKIHAYRKHVNKIKTDIESQCQKAGVPVQVILNAELRSISELALISAKKAKADLIICAAKSGPLTALIGGSITRQIIRTSNRPVMVLK